MVRAATSSTREAEGERGAGVGDEPADHSGRQQQQHIQLRGTKDGAEDVLKRRQPSRHLRERDCTG